MEACSASYFAQIRDPTPEVIIESDKRLVSTYDDTVKANLPSFVIRSFSVIFISAFPPDMAKLLLFSQLEPVLIANLPMRESHHVQVFLVIDAQIDVVMRAYFLGWGYAPGSEIFIVAKNRLKCISVCIEHVAIIQLS